MGSGGNIDCCGVHPGMGLRNRLNLIMAVTLGVTVIFLIIHIFVETDLLMFGALISALVFIITSGIVARRRHSEFKQITKKILEERGEDAKWLEREAIEVRRRSALYKLYFFIRVILTILVIALIWALV